MNIWLVLGIVLALGIVVGNILLLKYSANMTFEKSKKKSSEHQDETSKVNKQDH